MQIKIGDCYSIIMNWIICSWKSFKMMGLLKSNNLFRQRYVGNPLVKMKILQLCFTEKLELRKAVLKDSIVITVL